MPGLQMFKKGFYSHIGANQPIVAGTINLGSTKGRGSSTRMFNYCNQRSANPSECINQFITVSSSSIPTPIPTPTPTIIVYSLDLGLTFDWGTVTFTLDTNLPNYSYTAITNSIPAIPVPDTAPSSLIGVTIGNSVTSIGDLAFSNCPSLTSVTFTPTSTLGTIGDYAFISCTSLTSIIIPNSVTSIGDYAFESCTSLTSVTIGNSVTSIGIVAFNFCTSLISIEIPGSVTSIGSNAFSNSTNLTSINVATSNTNYSSFDGVLFNKLQTTLITFPGGKSGSYTIPGSVTSIGDYAFLSCTSLTSIIIPNSVTTIGDYAFESCTSLISVTIGNSVTTIGDYAFNSCSSLGTVTFTPTSTLGTIGEFAFFLCGAFTSIIIPASVTSIGSLAFSSSGLTTVTITNGQLGIVSPTTNPPGVDFFGKTVATILPPP
jgi:hypothetical protein